MRKQKIKAIVVKRKRAKRGISLSSKKKGNYENNIKNKTDPN